MERFRQEVADRLRGSASSAKRARVAEPAPRPFSLFDLTGNAEKTEVGEQQCCVCIENKKDVLLKPCKHVCVCVECARALEADNLDKSAARPQCPQCRAPIEHAERVFL